MDRQLGAVRDLLGLDTVQPMKAVIINSIREADRTFPLISQTARSSHTFGGFAYGEYDLFVLIGLGVGGMVHEMTHLLIDEALDSPFAQIPSWLNEGLAMYFEPGSRNNRSSMERAARADTLMSLRSMHRVPGRPTDVSRFYAQARNVVAYMIDDLGQERMATLLRAINDGQDIDEAVQTAYGLSLDQLDARWRSWLLGEPQPELSALTTDLADSSEVLDSSDSEGDSLATNDQQTESLADVDQTQTASAEVNSAETSEGDSTRSTLPAIVGGSVAAILAAAVARWLYVAKRQARSGSES